jgi:putative hydrolase of the HAD superfamily
MEKIFVFDLDNTLYPREVGLWEIIDRRIEDYVKKALNVDLETAKNVRKGFLKIYGTTLKGLMLNHSVDSRDYLSYVHNVDIEGMIQKDTELFEMFKSIPYQKYVFTNASHDHALRVLTSLGVERCFEEVLDIHFMDFLAKPGIYPFRKLVSYLGVSPGSIVFFDDFEENIITARKLGIISVLISQNGNRAEADMVIDSVKKIPSILGDILKSGGDRFDRN